jgi:hypothetical protein
MLKALAAERQLHALRIKAEQNTAAGNWGSSGVDSSTTVAIPELEDISRSLDKLQKSHEALLTTFTQQLPAQVTSMQCRRVLHVSTAFIKVP